MPFAITQLPDKKKSRVVALLLEGRGDGSERIIGPVIIDAWRRGGKLTVSSHHAGGHFELPDQYVEILSGQPDIQIGWTERSGPDFREGTGQVCGIALVGALGRGENDDAALARLRDQVPDIRGRWAAHCEAERSHFEDIRRSLKDRARDGFGLGKPIRFR